MKKIGKFIVKARYALLAVFTALVIISGILMTKVKINYDMTRYLDDSSSSSLSLEIMEDEFGSVGQCQVMVYSKDLTFKLATDLSEDITSVNGVASVVFASDEADTNYYKTENSINYAIYKVFLETGNYDTASYETLDRIRDTIKDFSKNNVEIKAAYNGGAVSNEFLTNALDHDMVIILAIVAVVVLVILAVVSTSWIEPIIFAIVVLVAILLNMGTNILLNYIPYIGKSMSFITKSIAAVMQLALSMDYAIVLLHAYKEKKAECDDKKEAMALAIAKSIAPVSSSSLTTVAGLVALMFMSFSIGFDVGLVLAKGIIISLLTVFLLMPAILLLADPLLEKTSHKTVEAIMIEFNEKRIARFQRHGKEAPTFSGFQRKTKFLIPALACIVILVGAILNFKSEYSFVLEASSDKTATVNVDDKKISDVFGTQNTMVVLIPKDSYSPTVENTIVTKLSNYQYKGEYIINSKQGLTTYGVNVPLTASQVSSVFNLDIDTVTMVFNQMKAYDSAHVTTIGDNDYITPEHLINFMIKNSVVDAYTSSQQASLDSAYESYKDSLYNADGSVNTTTLSAMKGFITAFEAVQAGLSTAIDITDSSVQQRYASYKQLTTIITKTQLQAKYSFATDDMANYIIAKSELRNDDTHLSNDTMYYFEVVTFASVNKVVSAYGQVLNQVLASKKLDIIKAYASLTSKFNPTSPSSYDSMGNVVIDDGYYRIIFNMNMPVSGEDSFKAINEIENYLYNESGVDGIQLVSETFVYSQIKDVFNKDIVLVNLISFFAILIIIAVTFKGAFVPALLTVLIQGAIWVTMGISTMAGQDIFFICYIVVMCVQMGATIDYAILLTTNYTQNRKTMNKINAMGKAMNSSMLTILTSGSILVLATLIIGLVSKVAIISDLGLLLSRGCLISVFTIIFCLPQFLMLCDKIIEKTTYKTKFYNAASAEFDKVQVSAEAESFVAEEANKESE